MVNDNDNNDHYHYHLFFIVYCFSGMDYLQIQPCNLCEQKQTTYYAGKLLRTFRGIYQELPTIEYNIGN
jgi:hypothetical protein